MDKMTKDAVRSGSSVVEGAYMYDYWLEYGKWYRSRDRKGGLSPFGSYLMNKKWTLAYMALPVPKFPVSSWNWGVFAIYVGLGTELVLVFCEFKGLVSNWFW